MVIASAFMGISKNALTKNFEVIIPLGAILSVVVLYWRRFFTSFKFYLKLAFAFLPVAVAGFFLASKKTWVQVVWLLSCCPERGIGYRCIYDEAGNVKIVQIGIEM